MENNGQICETQGPVTLKCSVLKCEMCQASNQKATTTKNRFQVQEPCHAGVGWETDEDGRGKEGNWAKALCAVSVKEMDKTGIESSCWLIEVISVSTGACKCLSCLPLVC